jgi:hypothetical protein
VSNNRTTTVLESPPSRGKGAKAPPASSAKEGKPDRVDGFFTRLIAFFSSLRLTVVCLFLGMLLVFCGTIAQVELGLFKAQNQFFRSFLVIWAPTGSWKIILPGGYLVGGFLLINLVTAHFTRFKWTRKKIGIWLAHIGVIMLLVGQLLTDLLSKETVLHLREGDTKNYSETERNAELAVIDVTDPNFDAVVAVPENLLAQRSDIRRSELPFMVRIKEFYANSQVAERPTDSQEPPAASRDIGTRAVIRELPRVTDMDHRDVPSGVVEIITPQGSIGTWLVSEYIDKGQSFTVGNRTFELALRPTRHYKSASFTLLKFSHDVYRGTDIPKNFSSRILLNRPDTGERREVLIYMNNPLRYQGETYYQASLDPDDRGTVLQVVHNPSWLTPYFSCILVAAGLIVQFLTHLIGFITKRITT